MKVARILFKKIPFVLLMAAMIFFTGTHSGLAGNSSSGQSGLDPVTSLKCNEFTFDASGSYDPDKEDISFLWEFGDGQTSTESVVNHRYNKSGDYDVTLTITDNSGLDCSTAIARQTVRANIPPIATFTADEATCVGQKVIIDGSGSYDDSRRKLDYDWDFGDGSKTIDEKRVTKSYSKGGDYKVSLTVDDGAATACSSQTFEKVIHVNEPPVADIGDDVILKCINGDNDLLVTFDASKSYDINNDPLIYAWDFGDGQRGEGVKTTHRYAHVGNYDAKVVVKDNTNLGCGTSVDFVTVRLNKAPKADAGSDVLACPGEIIDFDGTNSYIYKKGTIISKWTFGDGETSAGLKASHRYQKPGQYQASLDIENELNSMCSPSKDTRIVTVNSTPTVSIKAQESVCLGNPANFDASSATDADGDTLEYYWSFGDGTILREGAKVAHEYTQGGNYRVTIIVDDTKGTACSTATANTNIRVNTPPIADAGPNLSCCVGVKTNFNATASSDPDKDRLTFTWDFGDGNKANGPVAQHTYQKSGSYNVLLTVDDNSGTPCSKSTAGFVAQVNSTPVPVINVR